MEKHGDDKERDAAVDLPLQELCTVLRILDLILGALNIEKCCVTDFSVQRAFMHRKIFL